MKIKTSEAEGAALNWLVAKCEGYEEGVYMHAPVIRIDVKGKATGLTVPINREYVWFSPSTDWAQGGPIIAREKIATQFWVSEDSWEALIKGGFFASYGPTPLVAAMRCFVVSKLGDEVEVPDELA